MDTQRPIATYGMKENSYTTYKGCQAVFIDLFENIKR
jgi:hypothetical protein